MSALYALGILLMAPLSAAGAGGADLVLLNGRVITLTDPEPTPAPTAVAIRGNRIVHVGDDAGARALAGPGTRVIDLGGGVVVPGFCDAHAHLPGLGKALSQLDLRGTPSLAAAVARVREAVAGLPSGTWLEGSGWDQNDWEVQEFPTRAALDAVTVDHPVLLRRIDGHAAWVNSRALAVAGVTSATPEPAGGHILRDEAGAPTGMLIDNAVDLVRSAIPPPGRDEVRQRIRLAAQHCLALGLTGVHDAGARLETVDIYKELAAAGELELRLYVMLEDDPTTLDALLAAGPYRSGDGLLTVRAVKLYADGALGSRGALLLRDYDDEPGNRGIQVTSAAHLTDVMRRAGGAGFQVCTHAIGDAANRLVLDLYAQVQRELDLRDARWRVEHAQVLDAVDVPRFAALSVIASMQPVHCTSDMAWATARLGEARTAHAYAWRELLASGARLCFGTDFPVEKADPLAGLYAASTRTHPDGSPAGGWRPEQRLDTRSALILYTAGPAYAAFQEEELGRISPGALADLTVLDGDPIATTPAALRDLRVLLTIVDGRVRHERAFSK